MRRRQTERNHRARDRRQRRRGGDDRRTAAGDRSRAWPTRTVGAVRCRRRADPVRRLRRASDARPRRRHARRSGAAVAEERGTNGSARSTSPLREGRSGNSDSSSRSGPSGAARMSSSSRPMSLAISPAVWKRASGLCSSARMTTRSMAGVTSGFANDGGDTTISCISACSNVRGGLEQPVTGEQFVQHDTDGEDVGAVVDGLEARLLRGHVRDLALHRADLGVRLAQFLGDARDPEVEDLHPAVVSRASGSTARRRGGRSRGAVRSPTAGRERSRGPRRPAALPRGWWRSAPGRRSGSVAPAPPTASGRARAPWR